MDQFIENIVLHTIIAFLTVICYAGVFEKSTGARWKTIVFRVGAIAGTLWIIVKTWFFFVFIPPLMTAAAFLLFVWFFGVALLYFIKWLCSISDEEANKFLTWFFE